jgi:hypothetical protein
MEILNNRIYLNTIEELYNWAVANKYEKMPFAIDGEDWYRVVCIQDIKIEDNNLIL